MSARSRCHTCLHSRGPRSTNNLTKVKEGEPPRAKKRPCACSCHADTLARTRPDLTLRELD